MVDYQIISIPFKSSHPRNERKKGEDISVNQSFDLKFFMPKTKVTELVIILNGFIETDRTPYDEDISPSLASYGVASVLLPLPFHLDRQPHGSLTANTYALLDKDLFFADFLQTLKDVRDVAKLVKSEYNANGAAKIEKDCKIHLLGYSLGGLFALSSLLNDTQNEIEKLFDSCLLLCAGANFQTYENPVGFTEFEWGELKLHYMNLRHKVKYPDAGSNDIIFNRVFIGLDKPALNETLLLLSHRILLVIGAVDDINAPNSIIDLEPEESGLAIVQIPGLGHALKGVRWRTWHDFIINALVSFMRCHGSIPKMHPSSEKRRKIRQKLFESLSEEQKKMFSQLEQDISKKRPRKRK